MEEKIVNIEDFKNRRKKKSNSTKPYSSALKNMSKEDLIFVENLLKDDETDID